MELVVDVLVDVGGWVREAGMILVYVEDVMHKVEQDKITQHDEWMKTLYRLPTG